VFDFLQILTRPGKKGVVEVYPEFKIIKSKDLMIRGKDFYAIWLEEEHRWSTDEQDVLDIIDRELDNYAEKYREELKNKYEDVPRVKVLHIKASSTRIINSWHTYCTKDLRENWKPLDEKIIFLNDKTEKSDYSSKRVEYALEECKTPAYDTLMSVLYSEKERKKIEWAIGAIINGASKKIQKFLVLYGASGTGKSTVLNIIQKLFAGYYGTFDAKALGQAGNAFALESLKDNPLVAIQHDGDLSRIEDNTKLNSLTSHEEMPVNEKFKGLYNMRFNSFLFMGTNKPVRITDAKSGIIRRLIDVSPTGKLIPPKEYRRLIKDIDFELGGIAYHCKQVYESDPSAYDDYIPETMIDASNDFYDFVLDSYFVFKKEDSISLATAYEMYKEYCEDAKVPYPFSKRAFKEELKNYFEKFDIRSNDNARTRSVYSGFKTGLFKKNYKSFEENSQGENSEKTSPNDWLDLKLRDSILDDILKDCTAQYATVLADGRDRPRTAWDKVKTKLSDLDTTKLHYILAPEINGMAHIFVDFDLKDENGNKSFELNKKAASTWPKTYAETSKSDAGIHLHYIYTGDVSKLDNIYAENIEIKICEGKRALRRKLTRCNDQPIATISSGLPLKKEVQVVNSKEIQNEKHLRRLIINSMHKEYQPGTKPSMDFIVKLFQDAYNSDISYDLSDMYELIWDFAANSTHHADYCLGLLDTIKFKSKDHEEEVSEITDWSVAEVENDNEPVTIYDVETFKNLFVICWKYYDVDMPVITMINPTPDECLEFSKKKLVGFNCRKYDNHIVYGRIQHLTLEGLFELSQSIILNKSKSVFYGPAYDMSYTDIYDYCSKKQSLKKWEIELNNKCQSDYDKANKFHKDGLSDEEISKKLDIPIDTVQLYISKPYQPIVHKELGIPWDEPVPESRWEEVASYCCNDVLATEAVFKLTQKIIFGNERHPQSSFNYRNMAEGADHCLFDDEYTCFTSDEKPVFPGYEYKYVKILSKNGKTEKGAFKSLYRGEEVGEGGYVYAEPGIYYNVALLDIASMHPSSAIAEWLFGKYTQNFQDIVNARIFIKHKDFESAKKLFNGKLAKYLDDPDQAKQLAQALKIAINSVYGLTSASFENPFKDPRNKDNIVAKRGALFMINLKHQVQKRGFTVAHIKTDSIKIPNATPEIIQFVMDYGKLYGYNFEHEATYDKMCLANNAVYICYHDGKWDATGTQFQVPYVFKTLFSKEPIEFSDMCETKSVTGDSALYLDMNEFLPDVSELEKEYDKKLKELNKNDNDILREDLDQLSNQIAKGHNYQFVGRVSSFCPVKDGCGGGLLYRCKDGKYYSVAGSSIELEEEHNGKIVKIKKTYRWLEADVANNLNTPIARDYYDYLVVEARKAISVHGDVDEFINK